MESFRRNVMSVSWAYIVFAFVNYKLEFLSNFYFVNELIYRCAIIILGLMVVFSFLMFLEKERKEELRDFIISDTPVDVTNLTNRLQIDKASLDKRKKILEKIIEEENNNLGGDA